MNVILKPVQAQPLLATEILETTAARSVMSTNHVPAAIRSYKAIKSGTRGHVLVVDDNDCVRETLSELLEVVGFHVFQAPDAVQAMTILTQVPAIDVLVTDLTMPGDDGLMLIQQARLHKGDIPAILLTGYADQVTSMSTVAGCPVHMLRKPVEGERLIAQLDLFIRTLRAP